jgi:hypothetical protein
VVLDKIHEDSRRRAAFEERIENILVGSAAKRILTATSSCPLSGSSHTNVTFVLCTCRQHHLLLTVMSMYTSAVKVFVYIMGLKIEFLRGLIKPETIERICEQCCNTVISTNWGSENP